MLLPKHSDQLEHKSVACIRSHPFSSLKICYPSSARMQCLVLISFCCVFAALSSASSSNHDPLLKMSKTSNGQLFFGKDCVNQKDFRERGRVLLLQHFFQRGEIHHKQLDRHSNRYHFQSKFVPTTPLFRVICLEFVMEMI